MNNKKILDFQTIAVDFDGTLCYSKWPELGQPNLALIEYLQEWGYAFAFSGRLSLTASNSRFCSRHHSTAFDRASPARQVQRMSLLPLRFHSWRYSISAWLG